MEYDVFISYSRRDYVDSNGHVISGNIVSRIKELLDANGITYWFDQDGVYSGDAFAPLIARNIKSAKIFLFISSENSNASEWTSNEIATAHAYKKKIIPFKYDDSVFNDSVIIYIARLDYIEYKSNSTKSLERLLYSIKAYLKEINDKEEPKQTEQKQRQENNAELQALLKRIENLEKEKSKQHENKYSEKPIEEKPKTENQKHWLINIVCTIDLIVSILSTFFFLSENEGGWVTFNLLRISCIISLISNSYLGTISTAIITTIFSIFFGAYYSENQGIFMFFVMLFSAIAYSLMLTLCQNGVSAWELMRSKKKSGQE